MVRIRDLGISLIPGTRKTHNEVSCIECTDETSCSPPSCDKDKDKDKDKKDDKKAKYTGPFDHAAVAELRQRLRQQIGSRL